MTNLPNSRDYPEAQVTRIVFAALPEDDFERYHWSITVGCTGRPDGLWYVCAGSFVELGQQRLTKAGLNWTWDSRAYGRFPLDVAMSHAHRLLPDLKVNGMTATEVLAWRASLPKEGTT